MKSETETPFLTVTNRAGSGAAYIHPKKNTGVAYTRTSKSQCRCQSVHRHELPHKCHWQASFSHTRFAEQTLEEARKTHTATVSNEREFVNGIKDNYACRDASCVSYSDEEKWLWSKATDINEEFPD